MKKWILLLLLALVVFGIWAVVASASSASPTHQIFLPLVSKGEVTTYVSPFWQGTLWGDSEVFIFNECVDGDIPCYFTTDCGSDRYGHYCDVFMSTYPSAWSGEGRLKDYIKEE